MQARQREEDRRARQEAEAQATLQMLHTQGLTTVMELSAHSAQQQRQQQEVHDAALQAALQKQPDEHAKLLAGVETAHGAVLEGAKGNLSLDELGQLKAKEDAEKVLLAAQEERESEACIKGLSAEEHEAAGAWPVFDSRKLLAC